jgi:hypothetical protein
VLSESALLPVRGWSPSKSIRARVIPVGFGLVMAIGAILGGWIGAGTARRMGRTAVRRIVIGIGFAMAVSLFVKR